MKILHTSDNPDINYLAQVFRVEDISVHPNADKLQLVTIGGETVVTGLDCKAGEIYIHFTVGCVIDPKFLTWSNSYSESARNRDVNKKGFFQKHSRVKIVKLRAVPSNGYIIPASALQDYIKESYGITVDLADYLGQHFDSINGDRFVWKYVQKNSQSNNGGNPSKKEDRYDRIIPNQFRFHPDTINLRKVISKINPDDEIVIADKIHGTSFSVCRVLVRTPLSWKDKIAKWFGINVVEQKYDNLYASKAVIKSERNINGYYDTDIYKIVSDLIRPILTDGVSLYGEIYGFTPSGKAIQPKYDYGCNPGELDYIVYKGTITMPNGDVYTMSQSQLENYCSQRGIKTDEVFYRGKAKDLFPSLDIHNHWHKDFLRALEEKYLNRKCRKCRNDCWSEGIVIKIQQPFAWNCVKLRCFNFLGYEETVLDSPETSNEDS